MLQTVIDIVKEAADIMTSGDFTVKTKENPDNLVTSKDVAVEAFIRKAIAERIPDAGLVVEPGAGHFAYLEHSARFLRILKSFLLEGRE